MAEGHPDSSKLQSSKEESALSSSSPDNRQRGIIDIIPPGQADSQTNEETKDSDSSQSDKKLKVEKSPSDSNQEKTEEVKKFVIQTADKEVQTIAESTPVRLSNTWLVYAIVFLALCICLSMILSGAVPGSKENADSKNNVILTELTNCRSDATENRNIKANMTKQVKQLNKTRLRLENEVENYQYRTKMLELLNRDLEDRNALLQTDSSELKSQAQRLETRLSEVIWNVTKNDNDDFTQMEEYSKLKIAEEYKEVYDNEYTKAVIEMEKRGIILGPEKATKFFLDILKMSDNLCRNYSTSHMDSIRQSITNLQVYVPLDHEKQKYSQGASSSKDENETTVKRVNVTIDSKLSKLEWSQIFDIKRTAALRLLDPFIKILIDVVATEFDVEQEQQPKLITYINKCLRLCWMMNMHPKPVFIKFVEISDLTLFDTDTFKPFLASGRYLNYVVWPALYSHDGGKMLAKGVAEGKN